MKNTSQGALRPCYPTIYPTECLVRDTNTSSIHSHCSLDPNTTFKVPSEEFYSFVWKNCAKKNLEKKCSMFRENKTNKTKYVSVLLSFFFYVLIMYLSDDSPNGAIKNNKFNPQWCSNEFVNTSRI